MANRFNQLEFQVPHIEHITAIIAWLKVCPKDNWCIEEQQCMSHLIECDAKEGGVNPIGDDGLDSS